MEELQVQINQSAGEVSFNFEEMKAYLVSVLEEYKTAVFSDKNIPYAKKYVASLRKDQKALKDKITEVKKAYMAPFEEFKAQADELVQLYDEPIDFINGQVQDFERRRKEAKRESIEELYEQVFGPLVEMVPLDKVYDARWENATYKISDIEKDLTAMATKIATEIQVIWSNDHSPYMKRAEELYLATLDFKAAMTEFQKLEQIRQEEERRQQELLLKKEIEAAKREERERIEKEIEIENARSEAEQNLMEMLSADDPDGEVSAYMYCINLTEKQKEALEIYMNSVGLDWSEV